MKNLIISTFLILAMIVGGSMNNVPASVANLFGSVEASAQLKNPKACDSATGQVPYGEFVVNSASIEVVERDGKAGNPLPKNILVDAIKKSGFQDLAGKTDDQIIELAVKEQRCVISPINYVSVVVNAMSAIRLVYCGLSYTTKGNTFTKMNKQIVADAEGYGAYNVEVQCKPLPCPSGTIYTMVNGVQKCEPVPPTCPAGQLKNAQDVCYTPPAPICPPGQQGTYPNCQMPCPPGTTGTFMPSCVVNPPAPTPEPVCPAGSVKNPTTNICEVPCPQGTTKNAQNICEAPVAPKPSEETKKKGSGLGIVAVGVGLLAAGCIFFFCKKKTTNPPVPGNPPSVETPTVCKSANDKFAYKTQQESSRQLQLAKAARFTSATVRQGQSVSTKQTVYTLYCGAKTPPINACKSETSNVGPIVTLADANKRLAIEKPRFKNAYVFSNGGKYYVKCGKTTTPPANACASYAIYAKAQSGDKKGYNFKFTKPGNIGGNSLMSVSQYKSKFVKGYSFTSAGISYKTTGEPTQGVGGVCTNSYEPNR
jgi:hypothetical protein